MTARLAIILAALFLIGAAFGFAISAAIAWVGGWEFGRGAWALFVALATIGGGFGMASDYTENTR